MIRKSLVIGTLLLPGVLLAVDPTSVVIDAAQLSQITGANSSSNAAIEASSSATSTNTATIATNTGNMAADTSAMSTSLSTLVTFIKTYFNGLVYTAPGNPITEAAGSAINTWLTSVGEPGSKVNDGINAQATTFFQAAGAAPQSVFYDAHPLSASNNTTAATDPAFKDLNVGNLLNTDKIKTDKNSKTDDEKLASAIVQNIINPFPPSIDYSVDLKAADNKAEIASYMAQQATLAVAGNSYLTMLAMRASDKDGTASLMEQLNTESSWRFLNSKLNDSTPINWYAQINALSTEGLLRELAAMDAFRLYMEHQKFKQGERIEALLATMVASQGRLAKAMQSMGDSMKDGKKQSAAAAASLQSNSSAPQTGN
jgi:hypothetical protein